MLMRKWSNQKSSLLLVGMQYGTASLKGSLAVSENVHLHKNLPTDVHYNLVHNCENLKATKMSSNWCVD